VGRLGSAEWGSLLVFRGVLSCAVEGDRDPRHLVLPVTLGRATGHDIVIEVNRRPPPTSSEVHAQRRGSGGARREAAERVTLRGPGFETHGWTLNVSRGGIRAIVEEPLESGAEYMLVVGDADEAARKVAVVWVQDEADGQIVGVRYLDVEGSVPPQNA
jgi:PilZ domain